jgi:hypothetical protein
MSGRAVRAHDEVRLWAHEAGEADQDWDERFRKTEKTLKNLYSRPARSRGGDFFFGARRKRRVDELFQQYYREWKEETRFTSNVNHIILHPSYQRII